MLAREGARERASRLTFDAGRDRFRRRSSDPTRLRQILTNLVGNAIKFTEQGGVKVVARLAPADEDRLAMTIDVIDTGIGMPPEALEARSSSRSSRPTSVTRRFGGTGLGLAISRRFAQLLGGDITVDSELGQRKHLHGCTIDPGPLDRRRLLEPTEAMAAQQGPTSRPTARAEFALPGCRVLVVDDGAENRQLVKLVLVQRRPARSTRPRTARSASTWRGRDAST